MPPGLKQPSGGGARRKVNGRIKTKHGKPARFERFGDFHEACDFSRSLARGRASELERDVMFARRAIIYVGACGCLKHVVQWCWAHHSFPTLMLLVVLTRWSFCPKTGNPLKTSSRFFSALSPIHELFRSCCWCCCCRCVCHVD